MTDIVEKTWTLLWVTHEYERDHIDQQVSKIDLFRQRGGGWSVFGVGTVENSRLSLVQRTEGDQYVQS